MRFLLGAAAGALVGGVVMWFWGCNKTVSITVAQNAPSPLPTPTVQFPVGPTGPAVFDPNVDFSVSTG